MSDAAVRSAAEIIAAHAVRTCTDEAKGDQTKLATLLFDQSAALRWAALMVDDTAVRALATPGEIK
jgi:hypothetical protein